MLNARFRLADVQGVDDGLTRFDAMLIRRNSLRSLTPYESCRNMRFALYVVLEYLAE